MKRYFAFLRAVNVGGHTIKMEVLRQLFNQMGLQKVQTYIASGNVIFEAPNDDIQALEVMIQSELRQSLGYPMPVFIRSNIELSKISMFESFPRVEIEYAKALNIVFLQNNLDTQTKEKIMSLKTEIDDFNFTEREIFWKCLKKQSESIISNALLEKKGGFSSTIRGYNTIKTLAEKYNW